MSDEITLVLPRERDFHRVAHLVLGGLAARLDLTYESLEDLQLALDGLLGRDEGDGEIVVRIGVSEDAIEALVGPFEGEALRERARARRRRRRSACGACSRRSPTGSRSRRTARATSSAWSSTSTSRRRAEVPTNEQRQGCSCAATTSTATSRRANS